MYDETIRVRSIIATRLRVIRVFHKLTQKDFAFCLGINHLTYRGYENCKSDVPIPLLLRIANLYDVSMDYLTGLVSSINGYT